MTQPQSTADAAKSLMLAAAPHASVSLHTKDYGLSLSIISIPTEHRRNGEATAALQALTAYADAEKITLSLTPDSCFGISTRVLHRIYLAHGFTFNKGRHRDFRISDSMKRLPQ